jgi:hypothetical protein
MSFWKRGLGRVPAALAIAVVAALALPALASAADTYADPGGSDAANCLTPATACKTVGAALTKASSGNSVHLAAGTYAESVTLSLGKSLVATSPSGPQPVIDNGSVSSPAITVNASGAGSIDGLTIRSDFQPVLLNGPATVANDTFDENNVPSSTGSDVDVAGATAALVMNNAFDDPDASGDQTGVLTSGSVSPSISANTFTNLATAIKLGSTGATVSDNQISLGHAVGGTPGVGIAAIGGDPRIIGNTIGIAGSGSSTGVLMQDQHSFTVSQVVRNEIFGNTVGVKVTGETVSVHLDDDLIHDNTTGLAAVAAGAGGEARTNGVTFHNNGTDISLDSSTATVNSSILEQPITLVGGTESCTIAFSRGPATPVANGCSNYTTSASPQFVDAAGGDFHLQDTSPLIDAGDPAAASGGETDFYGNPRAVQGLACDRTQRDIGAAEFQPPGAPQCDQDTYASVTSGDDANDCISASSPCQTIAAALSKSTDGHTTFIADGTYNETPVLSNGKSLGALDSTDPKPVISASGSTAIFVDPSGAGTISGLHIVSNYRAIDVDGDVTIDGNTFDANPTADKPMIELRSGDDVHVQNNTFVDPNSAGFGIGVLVEASSGAPPVISNNSFSGLANGVLTMDGNPQISDNQITGAHPQPSSLLPGAGIVVGNGSPAISHNTISAPASVSNTDGIYVYVALGSTLGATLSRNTIKGANIGLQVNDSNTPVTLSDDLIYGNGIGLQATDANPVDGDGDISATDATIYNNTTADVRLSHANLNLDSSAIGSPIQLVSGHGNCTISYSRGPSTSVANGCSAYDTNASPGFVDPSTGNYHLQSNSQLIDIGDPADPGSGAVDVYGNPRAVQGEPCHPARRDIGAAEFQAGAQPQCAQDTYADAGFGSDDNDCLTPSSPCASAAAALSKSTPGYSTFLAAGTYNQALTVDGGRSLLSLDPQGPKPTVSAPTGQTAVTVASTGAGDISGLRIRSDAQAMEVDGSADIDANTFDSANVSSGKTIVIPSAARVTFTDNVLTDPDATGVDVGITSGAPDLLISGNTFSGLSAAVLLTDGAAEISGNQISGAHPLGSTIYGTLPGGGILVLGGTPAISSNTINAPTAHPVAGIYVKPAASANAGATLDHNRISGGDAGVQVIDTNQPVTLADDLVYGNTVGLSATDTSTDTPPSNQGNVSAANETFDNASDVQLSYTALTLDSSILMTPVDLVGSNGSCAITYSRGPAGGINGCGSFVTAASPLFANAAGGNYQLQSSSPLVDVGNPAAPGVGATDYYGSQRALQGKSCSTVRRDIGAAEFNPGANPGCGGGGGTGGGGGGSATPPGSGSSGGGGATAAKTPGRPKITKHPRARSADKTPTFKFSSDVAGSSFKCKLDRGKIKRCGSPKTYAVKSGKHVFHVMAIAQGKQGPAQVFRFKVTPKH